MYGTFCGAANSLSRIYAQAVAQQKGKLHQWTLKQHGEGSRVLIADVVGYFQNEIDYGEEDILLSAQDISLSARLRYAHQHLSVCTALCKHKELFWYIWSWSHPLDRISEG
ncbi:uncharacterized protein [Typha angustifolia]|uniref:uncharacterized protein isoform X2 n=1 Tax=Typha angustifolia TaxID=59011 RepID=UPI003C2C95B3